MKHSERDAKIVKLGKSGRTYASIAEQFGLTPGRISQILRAAVVEPRRAGRRRLMPLGFRNDQIQPHIERVPDPLEEIINSEEEG